MSTWLEELRRSTVRMTSGTVLEIGAGTGRNFSWLPTDVNWIGLEPDARRAHTLSSLARRHGFDDHVLVSGCERIELPDNSVDTVLSTLALCSVTSQEQSLAEISRVLKPHGSLVFMEHVAAHRGFMRGMLKATAPFTRALDHGCDPSRDTMLAINEAGFRCVEFTERSSMGIPVIAGRATPTQ